MELYNSAAETLPEDDVALLCKDGVDIVINADEAGLSQPSVASGPGPTCSTSVCRPLVSWDPSADLQEQLRLLGASNLKELPVRYLQKQTISALWWQYSASPYPGEKIVGQRRFREIFQIRWSCAIHFRKESSHAQCEECSRSSNFLQSARCDNAARQAVAQSWQMHLKLMNANRQIYWKARWLSRRQNW